MFACSGTWWTILLRDLGPVDLFICSLFGDLFQLEDDLFLAGPRTSGFILFLFLGTLFFHPDFGLPTYPKAEKD